MGKRRCFGWERTGIGIAIGVLAQLSAIAALPSLPTTAQIIPDTTLGTEGSRITPNANVPTLPLPVDLIEGGAQRGSNLFHSFLEFNVNTGQQVYFTNPTGINNIFSRVTGNNVSNILGTLGVNGNANLFLINPNGILFGPNARLDINGSFLATTATRFTFSNGTEFNATNPQAPPLLTISVPLGVQYGSQAGTITNRGNLRVGQDLTLTGGNLDIQGQLSAGRDLTLEAQDTVRVRDSAVNPFIASAGGKLVVQGNQVVDILALNHPNSGFYSGGDMLLRSANTIGGDAHYWAGGSFKIETLDGNLGNLSSPYDPIILSSGDVTLGDYTGASLHILAGGNVTLGNVIITGTDTDGNTIHPGNTTLFNNTQSIASLANFTLSDGTPITIRGNTTPTLDVRAGINWAALGGFPVPDPTVLGTIANPQITAASGASITVNGGITNVQPNSLVLLTNQFQPNTTGGNILVNSISTVSENSGSIIIDSRGNFTPFGNLNTTTLGSGAGGNINIRATGDIRLDGVQILSNTASSGDAGSISIAARSLSLTNGGKITSTSQSGSTGNAGNIALNIPGSIELRGIDSGSGNQSGIFVTVGSQALGNGGNITINTNSLSLIDGGAIANTINENAQGNAGNIALNVPGGNITVTGQIVFNNNTPDDDRDDQDRVSNISSSVGQGTVGNGGTITMVTTNLFVTNGAFMRTNMAGTGSDGGDINIQVNNKLVLDGYGQLFTTVQGGTTPQGGNITISARSLEIQNNSALRTNSSNPVSAPGNIFINASEQISINQSQVHIDSNHSTSGFGRIIMQVGQGSVFLNQATVSNKNQVSGLTGDIIIQANDRVVLDGGSQLLTTLQGGTTPQGGNINVGARSIEIQNNSAITTESNNPVSAPGNIFLTGNEQVAINQSQVTMNSQHNTGGLSTINIASPAGSVFLNQATISATNQGSGLAGDIFINARDRIEITNTSNIAADGYLGRIFVGASTSNPDLGSNPSTLVIDNSTLTTTNTVINGSQSAGNIFLRSTNSAKITNNSTLSGLTTGVAPGGSIDIKTPSLLVDSSKLIVNSESQGNAGDITINTRSTILDNGASIAAKTTSGNGGNIAISVEDQLVLRRNSEIFTSSGSLQNPGNGGIITINAKDGFVTADPLENSDIIAIGFDGQGGKINIQASRIIGLTPRSDLTPEQLLDLRNNGISDITIGFDQALEGKIEIQNQNDNSIQGLAELSNRFVDPSRLIVQGCKPRNSKDDQEQSEFVVTGRGGLPPSPDQPLSSGAVPTPWVTRNMGRANNAATGVAVSPSTPKARLIEAQGMVFGPNGEIILTAEVPTSTPHQSGFYSPLCP